MALSHSNAPIALAAAASWGGGDFSGGMGARASNGSTYGTLRLLLIADIASLPILLLLCILLHAPVPHGASMLWALAAGFVAAFAITAFYVALSRGLMGASAAISGLLAAAVPAVVSSALEGTPGAHKLIGFLFAAAAIWLIAAGPAPKDISAAYQRVTMTLTVFAGLGFGFYFVALRMADSLGVLEPLALARTSCLILCVILLLLLRLRSSAASRGPA